MNQIGFRRHGQEAWHLTRSLSFLMIVLLFSGCGVTVTSPCFFSSCQLVLSGPSEVQSGQVAQFTATLTGLKNPSVDWRVNGLVGGSAASGSIDPDGHFTAPEVSTPGVTVTVAAVSREDSSLSATKVVTIAQISSGVPPSPSSAGTLQFEAPGYTTTEASGTIVLSVTRTGGSSGAVSAVFGTSDGTAANGRDYKQSTGTASWADGDSASKMIQIPILDAKVSGGSRQFTVMLTSPSGGATLGLASSTVSISDDDPPAPPAAGAIFFSSATENGFVTDPSITLAVLRVGGTSGAITVHYATFDGSAVAGVDYTASSGQLTWADGDAGAKSVTVPLLNPMRSGGSAIFTVTLDTPTGGAALGSPAMVVVSIADNVSAPSAGVVQFAAGQFTINETAGNVTLNLIRTDGSRGAISVVCATQDGSAVAGRDYSTSQQTLNWADGDTRPKTVAVPILNPGVSGGTRNFSAILSSAAGMSVLGPVSTAVVSINDIEVSSSMLQFTASSVAAANTDSLVNLLVSRTGNASTPVTVEYHTVDGSATAPGAYTAQAGGLSWASNDTSSKAFSIPILHPASVTAPQSFSVALANPSSGAQLGGVKSTTVVIDNSAANAAGYVEWSSTGYDANETDSFVTLTANRTGGTQGRVSVTWSTTDGTAKTNTNAEYGPATEVIGWNDGYSSPIQIRIPIYNRNIYGDPPHTFTVTLSQPSGGALVGSPATATVSIHELTNSAGAAQLSAAQTQVDEDGGSVQVLVNRAGGNSGAVTAKLLTSDGTATGNVDYTPVVQVLTWADQDTTPKAVSIPILNAGISGGSKTFAVRVNTPTGGMVIGSPATETILIQDNAPPPPQGVLAFSAVSYVVQENGGSAAIHLQRVGGSAGAVSATYAATPGSATPDVDYAGAAASGTVQWADGDQTDKTISIPVFDNHLDGGYLRTLTLLLTNASGGASLGSPNRAVVNIVENDTGDSQLRFLTPQLVTSESSGTVKLLVQRTTDYTGPASVHFATSDGTAQAGVDYVAQSGDLYWGDGEATAQVITVPILNPGLTSGARAFTITLSSPSGATIASSSDATARIAIVDDDQEPNSCPTQPAPASLGNPPLTTCGGHDLSGTSLASYPACSGLFRWNNPSSFVSVGVSPVPANGYVTAKGSNDFFYGRFGLPYSIEIPENANLSVSEDNGVKTPCSPQAAGEIGSIPIESEDDTPFYSVLAVSGGTIVNKGFVNTYPLQSSTANNYLPTSVAILHLSSNSDDQIINFGSIGDFYVTQTGSKITSNYGSYNAANPNGSTLGYAQMNFAAIYLKEGSVINAPGAEIRGDNAIFSQGTHGQGAVYNYGSIIAENDGYLGGAPFYNYSNSGVGLFNAIYDAVHTIAPVWNYGYMLGGAYAIEAGGRRNIITTYGGPPVPGAAAYDGSQIYGGEIYVPGASSAVALDGGSEMQLNLVSRQVNGQTWLPIVVGFMDGHHDLSVPNPSLNSLNFNFSGLTQSEYTTLLDAIQASYTTTPQGWDYTGSVTLQGHVYQWRNFAYVNFTGVPPS